MSQVITDAFASYWQQCLVDQTPVVLDEFVLAHIPGLDPDAPIDPASGLPPSDQIVHRHAVDQRGRINNDAVAYSIVMDTTVGDFTFNAMYLINTGLNLVGMIVHKGEETKLKTDPASGQTGNSLVKSMLMEYDRAAEASQTVIDASTWQIDYAARLRGMDEDMRRQAMGTFGHAAFYGDGFKLVNAAGLYKVQPGQGYVGGLLVELTAEQEVTPSAKPVSLWLDVYRAGSLLSPWVNQVTLTLSTADLVDYVDANGYPHFVSKLAMINADDSVTDTRARRTLTLTGDVSGEASFNGPDSIALEVHVEDNSHGHTIDNVEGLQEALDGKAEAEHQHEIADVNGLQGALDGKSPTGHTHTPEQAGALPVEAYKPRSGALDNTEGEIAVFAGDMNLLGMGSVVLAEMDTCTNTPAGATGYLYTETRSIFSTGALQQIAWPYDGQGAAWHRYYSMNTYTWSAWVKLYDSINKPTATEINARPMFIGVIGPGSDWNAPNYCTPGTYQVEAEGTGAFGPNAPVGANYGYGLMVCEQGSSFLTQTFYPHSHTGKISQRIRYAEDIWVPWVYLYSTGTPQTAAETGALPVQTFSSISHPPFRVTYTNTTGLPMMVSCNTTGLGYDTNSLVDMSIVLDAGTTPVFLSIKKDSSGEYDDLQKGSGACMVPPGSTFTVTAHDAILGFSTTFALTPFSTAGMRLYVNPATFDADGVIRAFTCDEERDEWAPACSVEVPAIPDGWSHERHALVDGAWVIRPEWLAMVEVTEIEGRRARMMAAASAQAQHFTMMGDTGQADAWRAHYQALYALEQLPEWPLVEQWPVAPELAV